MPSKKTQKITTTYEAPEKIDAQDPFYGFILDEEQIDFVNALLNKDSQLVIVDACAGCGKTTLSFATANLLVQGGRFDKIVYVRSVTNTDVMGFLPGTLEEKTNVYFAPAYQAIEEIGLNPMQVICSDENAKIGEAFIELTTDTFLRGTNLSKSVIIIDEAQNYTALQLKTVLTRVHDDCLVILIGDTKQCDLRDKQSSGFTPYKHYAKRTIEANVEKPNIKVCHLTHNYRGDISRWAEDLFV